MENNIVELDVREDLKNKLEPFQKIMQAIANLNKGNTLVLHAPFSPVPLFGVLKAKGFTNKEEKLGEKHYQITFTKE